MEKVKEEWVLMGRPLITPSSGSGRLGHLPEGGAGCLGSWDHVGDAQDAGNVRQTHPGFRLDQKSAE